MSSDTCHDQLHLVEGNEFLPTISLWTTLGGGVLVSIFGAAIALSTVLNYRVTVKTPATIRPAGELRLVQTAISGTVEHIEVQENQLVKAGQAIAQLDDSRLQTTRIQLQGDIRHEELQLTQINAQLDALARQILAETNLSQRTIMAAQEELISRQRTLKEQQITTQANLQEASAALDLAQQELDRYQQLAGTGAIAQIQITEKATAVKVALAKLLQTKAALNPTDAVVAMAKEQIAQEQAKGAATLATLKQQREQLLESRIELENQLHRTQKELRQVLIDLSRSVVVAPVTGTLLQLKLRNPGQVVQPGEAVVYIAPLNAPLLIKAQVEAQDIDKVKSGQNVQMQVSACPYPDYGTLKGTVSAVAPDALPVATTSAATTPHPVYEVTIEPQTRFVGNEEHQCRLQSGMEGRADIISRQETVLQFILRKTRLITDL